MKCKIEFELPDAMRGSIENGFVKWKFKGFSGIAKAIKIQDRKASNETN